MSSLPPLWLAGGGEGRRGACRQLSLSGPPEPVSFGAGISFALEVIVPAAQTGSLANQGCTLSLLTPGPGLALPALAGSGSRNQRHGWGGFTTNIHFSHFRALGSSRARQIQFLVSGFRNLQFTPTEEYQMDTSRNNSCLLNCSLLGVSVRNLSIVRLPPAHSLVRYLTGLPPKLPSGLLPLNSNCREAFISLTPGSLEWPESRNSGLPPGATSGG